jgi:hypothetical protein
MSDRLSTFPRIFSGFLAMAALASALPACIDGNAAFDARLHLSAPVEVGDSLVFLDSGRQRMTRLHSVDGEIAQDAAPFDLAPLAQVVTPDGKLLLLLDAVFAKGHQRLGILGGTGGPDFLQFNTAYSGLSVADDSQAVLAYHAPNAVQAGLVIAAELSLVDLAANPRSVQTATISGISTQPLAAHVSGPVTLADGVHRLAWLETVSALGIADFGGKGAARTLVIPLATAGVAANLVPKRTVARVEGSTVHLYLIASNSNDAVHISLDLSAPNMVVSLDQIASGPQPADIALVDTAAGLRILTVHAGAAQLSLLNPTTGTGTAVTLSTPSQHIQPYLGADGKPHALLWGDNNPVLQRVDIEDIDKKKGKAVHDVTAGAGVAHVTALQSRFLIQHNGAQLSAYDAENDRMTALSGMGSVKDVRVLTDAIWVLGSVQGGMRLARIDLANLSAQSMELTLQAAGIRAWGANGVALWADDDGSGTLLALPTGALDLDTAKLVKGFALTGATGEP